MSDLDSFSYFLPYVLDSTEAAARETLEQVMAEALSKSGSNRSAVQAVCLGVSGVNHPTDQEMILSWLRFGIWKFSLTFLHSFDQLAYIFIPCKIFSSPSPTYELSSRDSTSETWSGYLILKILKDTLFDVTLWISFNLFHFYVGWNWMSQWESTFKTSFMDNFV